MINPNARSVEQPRQRPENPPRERSNRLDTQSWLYELDVGLDVDLFFGVSSTLSTISRTRGCRFFYHVLQMDPLHCVYLLRRRGTYGSRRTS